VSPVTPCAPVGPCGPVAPVAPVGPGPLVQVICCSVGKQAEGETLLSHEMSGAAARMRTPPRSGGPNLTHAVTDVVTRGAAAAAPEVKIAATPRGATAASTSRAAFIASTFPQRAGQLAPYSPALGLDKLRQSNLSRVVCNYLLLGLLLAAIRRFGFSKGFEARASVYFLSRFPWRHAVSGYLWWLRIVGGNTRTDLGARCTSREPGAEEAARYSCRCSPRRPDVGPKGHLSATARATERR
jgi:hypothetical protein